MKTFLVNKASFQRKLLWRLNEIRVHPLSFYEYYSAVGGDKYEAFDYYAFYGGLPFVLSRPDDKSKMSYLRSLFSEVYLKDIIERKKIKGRSVEVAREIDFIATLGGKKVYIQSAYALESDSKIKSENKPFSLTGDSFPKIIVRQDIRKRWYDDNGILNIGIIDFLLDRSLI